MTTDGLLATLAQVIDRLGRLAAADPELRALLHALARQVVEATEPPTVATALPGTAFAEPAEPAEPPWVAPVPSQAPLEPPLAAPPPLPYRYLTPNVAPARTTTLEVQDDELRVVRERCLIKARGARWAAQRRQKILRGADVDLEIEPLDRKLIEDARRLPDCFLWMNHPSGPSPADLVLLEELGGCFEVNADALDLTMFLVNDPDPVDREFEDGLNLLAESQAGLRVAVERVGYPRDPDQFRTYNWLRARCRDAMIYIHRYMRLSDDPDPADWAELGQRIEALESGVRARHQLRRDRESALKRIAYHLKPIVNESPGDRLYDWQKIITTVDGLVAAGLPPSAVELRELLVPAIDLIPDVPLPPSFERVLREIDRFLASRPAPLSQLPAAADRPEIARVADLLRGRTIVLIGGERRPQAQEALRRSFDLSEVDWIEAREHSSSAPFEAHVARPEVAIVILAIRWTSHSFGEVKAFCDQYDKPLVRLPGGYNPGQVAVQVLAQCGERLAADS